MTVRVDGELLASDIIDEWAKIVPGEDPFLSMFNLSRCEHFLYMCGNDFVMHKFSKHRPTSVAHIVNSSTSLSSTPASNFLKLPNELYFPKQ